MLRSPNIRASVFADGHQAPPYLGSSSQTNCAGRARSTCADTHHSVSFTPGWQAEMILPMIFGVNTTKKAVFIAETHGTGKTFAVDRVRRVSFQLRQASDLADLLNNLSAILGHKAKRANRSVAILKCSGGRFSSALEAIKAEAVAELAAFQNRLPVIEVRPQSLKKALGCATDQKWRDRATQMFNKNDAHEFWTKGLDGAISAAYKVAAGQRETGAQD